VVKLGWHSNRNRFDSTFKRSHVRHRFYAHLGCHTSRPISIDINNGLKPNIWQSCEYPRVMAAKVTNAHNCDSRSPVLSHHLAVGHPALLP
tara:strand:- start:83 stop:355 length:273 start_codon:yes stop_codon:yes gene_type:complete